MQTTNSNLMAPLPGISPDLVEKANLQFVEGPTALKLCGIDEPGLLIPYYDFYGDPINEIGGEFYRLRLASPNSETGQKYHQRAGTSAHAYLPPNAINLARDAHFIVIIEGEKKALSLAELPAIMPVGIGGFYNFQASGGLVPELEIVLESLRENEQVVFYGDRDVVFNYQFSHAACELAKLIQPRSLTVSCLPIDAPGKGVDDCKQEMGDKFLLFFVKSITLAITVESGLTPASLAVQLLESKIPDGWKPPPSDADTILRGFAKLAASLNSYPLEEKRVIDRGIAITGVRRAPFKALVKTIRSERQTGLDPEALNSETVIDLNQQPGVWVRQTLKILGRSTYLFAENICDYHDGKLEPHNSASLVTRIDDPKCCSFVSSATNGTVTRKHITEKEARLVQNAYRANRDILRVVKVLSPVPVLAFTGSGTKLINDYCPETKILAAGAHVEIIPPEIGRVHLLQLLGDFDFNTPGDKGRALAMLLTLVLTRGGFLGIGRSPFFMIEKDKIGAGGGTLARLTAIINGVKPVSITPGDPKTAREDISKPLLQGVHFINFDNIRGNIMTKLPFFESLLTEPEFICRAPYLHGTADVGHCVFLCTSNGAVLSHDLAARTVKIGIRKRPENYRFHKCDGRYLLDHVAHYQSHYLGCIFGLIKDWADRKRPSGQKLTGFRMGEWECAATWIIENHFLELSVIDDSHMAAQKRLSSPDFELLRSVFLAVIDSGRADLLSCTELVRIAVAKNIMETDDRENILKMGRILSREFPNENTFDIAGQFRVVRKDTKDTNSDHMKQYSVTLLSRPQ